MQVDTIATGSDAVRAVCKASVPKNMVSWVEVEYKISTNGKFCEATYDGKPIFMWRVLAGLGINWDS